MHGHIYASLLCCFLRRVLLQVIKADVCSPGVHAHHVRGGCWSADGLRRASLLIPQRTRPASAVHRVRGELEGGKGLNNILVLLQCMYSATIFKNCSWLQVHAAQSCHCCLEAEASELLNSSCYACMCPSYLGSRVTLIRGDCIKRGIQPSFHQTALRGRPSLSELK